MILAVLLAAATAALGVGAALLAKRASPAKWGGAQAAASIARVVFAGAGMWTVWRLTGRSGPLVVYVFLAAILQMVALIYLLNKSKLT
jgi:hypothetical protein